MEYLYEVCMYGYIGSGHQRCKEVLPGSVRVRGL